MEFNGHLFSGTSCRRVDKREGVQTLMALEEATMQSLIRFTNEWKTKKSLTLSKALAEFGQMLHWDELVLSLARLLRTKHIFDPCLHQYLSITFVLTSTTLKAATPFANQYILKLHSRIYISPTLISPDILSTVR
jgi:hypothetical protein